MDKLAQEQRDKYIRDQGSRCPYCNTSGLIARGTIKVELITRDAVQVNEDNLAPCQNVHCQHCNRRWVDVFGLCDIKEYSL